MWIDLPYIWVPRNNLIRLIIKEFRLNFNEKVTIITHFNDTRVSVTNEVIKKL